MLLRHNEAGYRPGAHEGTAVVVDERRDGTLLVHNPEPLHPYPAHLTERLVHWARQAPDRPFLVRRDATGAWQSITFADMLARARRLGQALLDRGLSAERPLVILSENDLEHGALATAAQFVGIPYAPISPAYSLVSRDFGKLKDIVKLLTPGLVYAADGERYAAAMAAAVPAHVEIAVRARPPAAAAPHCSTICSPPPLPRPWRRPMRPSAPIPSPSSCSPPARRGRRRA